MEGIHASSRDSLSKAEERLLLAALRMDLIGIH